MTDSEFLAAFHACKFTMAEWTHEAHVRMAFLLLKESPYDLALTRVRDGINQLNSVIGVAKVGYHETITQTCLRLISHRISDSPELGWDEFRSRNADLMHFSFIEKFYSKERLFLPEAKQRFI